MLDKQKIKNVIFLIAFIIFIIKPRLLFSLIFWIVLGYIFIIKILPQLKDRQNSHVIDMNDPFQKIKYNFNNFISQFFRTSSSSDENDVQKNSVIFKNMQKSIGFGVVVVIAILVLIKSVIIIPPGITGINHLFGKIRDNELSSGLHLVNPLSFVEKMSIRTEEYTMSNSQGEGKKAGADAIDALTKEGLNIILEITVLYHLEEDKASNIFKELGTNFEEKLIRPQIRSVIRGIIAQYEAKDIYSEKRKELSKQILEKLIEEIGDRGIVVENVLLRDVNLPEKLEASIQEKLTAEQDAERYSFILDKEKKEKERKIIEAEGQRDAQKIINESLSEQYLQYLYIQGLKDRQGTIYVPTSPNNGLPIFKGL